ARARLTGAARARLFLLQPPDFGAALRLAPHLGIQAGDLRLQRLAARAGVARPPPRRLAEGIVLAQVQDLAQDPLPLAWAAPRKLVRPALEDEGGVDEGVVVHPQHARDPLLRAPHAALTQRSPVAVAAQLELQVGLPLLPPRSLPHHAVALPLQLELELHLHRLLVQAHQVVRRRRARDPPECPGDRIEQRRLPMPIAPAEACQ